MVQNVTEVYAVERLVKCLKPALYAAMEHGIKQDHNLCGNKAPVHVYIVGKQEIRALGALKHIICRNRGKTVVFRKLAEGLFGRLH